MATTLRFLFIVLVAFGSAISYADNADKTSRDCSQDASICHRHGFCIVDLKMCICETGYAGDGITCTDVNECEVNDNPCKGQNDDKCVNIEGGYLCCDPILSDNQCIKEKGAYCSGGCGRNAFCFNQTCTCMGGFQGDPQILCEDINECESDLLCNESGQWCVNRIGSHICCDSNSTEPECQGFSIGDGNKLFYNENDAIIHQGKKYTTIIERGESVRNESGGAFILARGNESDYSGEETSAESNGIVFSLELPACNENSSATNCPDNSECTQGRCLCISGFEFRHSTGLCLDIDECAKDPRPCSEVKGQWCVNTNGGYLCCDKFSTPSECLGLEIVPLNSKSGEGGLRSASSDELTLHTGSKNGKWITETFGESHNASGGQFIITRGKIFGGENIVSTTEEPESGLEIIGHPASAFETIPDDENTSGGEHESEEHIHVDEDGSSPESESHSRENRIQSTTTTTTTTTVKPDFDLSSTNVFSGESSTVTTIKVDGQSFPVSSKGVSKGGILERVTGSSGSSQNGTKAIIIQGTGFSDKDFELNPNEPQSGLSTAGPTVKNTMKIDGTIFTFTDTPSIETDGSETVTDSDNAKILTTNQPNLLTETGVQASTISSEPEATTEDTVIVDKEVFKFANNGTSSAPGKPSATELPTETTKKSKSSNQDFASTITPESTSTIETTVLTATKKSEAKNTVTSQEEHPEAEVPDSPEIDLYSGETSDVNRVSKKPNETKNTRKPEASSTVASKVSSKEKDVRVDHGSKTTSDVDSIIGSKTTDSAKRTTTTTVSTIAHTETTATVLPDAENNGSAKTTSPTKKGVEIESSTTKTISDASAEKGADVTKQPNSDESTRQPLTSLPNESSKNNGTTLSPDTLSKVTKHPESQKTSTETKIGNKTNGTATSPGVSPTEEDTSGNVTSKKPKIEEDSEEQVKETMTELTDKNSQSSVPTTPDGETTTRSAVTDSELSVSNVTPKTSAGQKVSSENPKSTTISSVTAKTTTAGAEKTVAENLSTTKLPATTDFKTATYAETTAKPNGAKNVLTDEKAEKPATSSPESNTVTSKNPLTKDVNLENTVTPNSKTETGGSSESIGKPGKPESLQQSTTTSPEDGFEVAITMPFGNRSTSAKTNSEQSEKPQLKTTLKPVPTMNVKVTTGLEIIPDAETSEEFNLVAEVRMQSTTNKPTIVDEKKPDGDDEETFDLVAGVTMVNSAPTDGITAKPPSTTTSTRKTGDDEVLSVHNTLTPTLAQPVTTTEIPKMKIQMEFVDRHTTTTTTTLPPATTAHISEKEESTPQPQESNIQSTIASLNVSPTGNVSDVSTKATQSPFDSASTVAPNDRNTTENALSSQTVTEATSAEPTFFTTVANTIKSTIASITGSTLKKGDNDVDNTTSTVSSNIVTVPELSSTLSNNSLDNSENKHSTVASTSVLPDKSSSHSGELSAFTEVPNVKASMSPSSEIAEGLNITTLSKGEITSSTTVSFEGNAKTSVRFGTEDSSTAPTILSSDKTELIDDKAELETFSTSDPGAEGDKGLNTPTPEDLAEKERSPNKNVSATTNKPGSTITFDGSLTTVMSGSGFSQTTESTPVESTKQSASHSNNETEATTTESSDGNRDLLAGLPRSTTPQPTFTTQNPTVAIEKTTTDEIPKYLSTPSSITDADAKSSEKLTTLANEIVGDLASTRSESSVSNRVSTKTTPSEGKNGVSELENVTKPTESGDNESTKNQKTTAFTVVPKDLTTTGNSKTQNIPDASTVVLNLTEALTTSRPQGSDQNGLEILPEDIKSNGIASNLTGEDGSLAETTLNPLSPQTELSVTSLNGETTESPNGVSVSPDSVTKKTADENNESTDKPDFDKSSKTTLGPDAKVTSDSNVETTSTPQAGPLETTASSDIPTKRTTSSLTETTQSIIVTENGTSTVSVSKSKPNSETTKMPSTVTQNSTSNFQALTTIAPNVSESSKKSKVKESLLTSTSSSDLTSKTPVTAEDENTETSSTGKSSDTTHKPDTSITVESEAEPEKKSNETEKIAKQTKPTESMVNVGEKFTTPLSTNLVVETTVPTVTDSTNGGDATRGTTDSSEQFVSSSSTSEPAENGLEISAIDFKKEPTKGSIAVSTTVASAEVISSSEKPTTASFGTTSGSATDNNVSKTVTVSTENEDTKTTNDLFASTKKSDFTMVKSLPDSTTVPSNVQNLVTEAFTAQKQVSTESSTSNNETVTTTTLPVVNTEGPENVTESNMETTRTVHENLTSILEVENTTLSETAKATTPTSMIETMLNKIKETFGGKTNTSPSDETATAKALTNQPIVTDEFENQTLSTTKPSNVSSTNLPTVVTIGNENVSKLPTAAESTSTSNPRNSSELNGLKISEADLKSLGETGSEEGTKATESTTVLSLSETTKNGSSSEVGEPGMNTIQTTRTNQNNATFAPNTTNEEVTTLSSNVQIKSESATPSLETTPSNENKSGTETAEVTFEPTFTPASNELTRVDSTDNSNVSSTTLTPRIVIISNLTTTINSASITPQSVETVTSSNQKSTGVNGITTIQPNQSDKQSTLLGVTAENELFAATNVHSEGGLTTPTLLNKNTTDVPTSETTIVLKTTNTESTVASTTRTLSFVSKQSTSAPNDISIENNGTDSSVGESEEFELTGQVKFGKTTISIEKSKLTSLIPDVENETTELPSLKLSETTMASSTINSVAPETNNVKTDANTSKSGSNNNTTVANGSTESTDVTVTTPLTTDGIIIEKTKNASKVTNSVETPSAKTLTTLTNDASNTAETLETTTFDNRATTTEVFIPTVRIGHGKISSHEIINGPETLTASTPAVDTETTVNTSVKESEENLSEKSNSTVNPEISSNATEINLQLTSKSTTTSSSTKSANDKSETTPSVASSTGLPTSNEKPDSEVDTTEQSLVPLSKQTVNSGTTTTKSTNDAPTDVTDPLEANTTPQSHNSNEKGLEILPEDIESVKLGTKLTTKSSTVTGETETSNLEENVTEPSTTQSKGLTTNGKNVATTKLFNDTQNAIGVTATSKTTVDSETITTLATEVTENGINVTPKTTNVSNESIAVNTVDAQNKPNANGTDENAAVTTSTPLSKPSKTNSTNTSDTMTSLLETTTTSKIQDSNEVNLEVVPGDMKAENVKSNSTNVNENVPEKHSSTTTESSNGFTDFDETKTTTTVIDSTKKSPLGKTFGTTRLPTESVTEEAQFSSTAKQPLTSSVISKLASKTTDTGDNNKVETHATNKMSETNPVSGQKMTAGSEKLTTPLSTNLVVETTVPTVTDSTNGGDATRGTTDSSEQFVSSSSTSEPAENGLEISAIDFEREPTGGSVAASTTVVSAEVISSSEKPTTASYGTTSGSATDSNVKGSQVTENQKTTLSVLPEIEADLKPNVEVTTESNSSEHENSILATTSSFYSVNTTHQETTTESSVSKGEKLSKTTEHGKNDGRLESSKENASSENTQSTTPSDIRSTVAAGSESLTTETGVSNETTSIAKVSGSKNDVTTTKPTDVSTLTPDSLHPDGTDKFGLEIHPDSELKKVSPETEDELRLPENFVTTSAGSTVDLVTILSTVAPDTTNVVSSVGVTTVGSSLQNGTENAENILMTTTLPSTFVASETISTVNRDATESLGTQNQTSVASIESTTISGSTGTTKSESALETIKSSKSESATTPTPAIEQSTQPIESLSTLAPNGTHENEQTETPDEIRFTENITETTPAGSVSSNTKSPDQNPELGKASTTINTDLTFETTMSAISSASTVVSGIDGTTKLPDDLKKSENVPSTSAEVQTSSSVSITTSSSLSTSGFNISDSGESEVTSNNSSELSPSSTTLTNKTLSITEKPLTTTSSKNVATSTVSQTNATDDGTTFTVSLETTPGRIQTNHPDGVVENENLSREELVDIGNHSTTLVPNASEETSTQGIVTETSVTKSLNSKTTVNSSGSSSTSEPSESTVETSTFETESTVGTKNTTENKDEFESRTGNTGSTLTETTAKASSEVTSSGFDSTTARSNTAWTEVSETESAVTLTPNLNEFESTVSPNSGDTTVVTSKPTSHEMRHSAEFKLIPDSAESREQVTTYTGSASTTVSNPDIEIDYENTKNEHVNRTVAIGKSTTPSFSSTTISSSSVYLSTINSLSESSVSSALTTEAPVSAETTTSSPLPDVGDEALTTLETPNTFVSGGYPKVKTTKKIIEEPWGKIIPSSTVKFTRVDSSTIASETASTLASSTTDLHFEAISTTQQPSQLSTDTTELLLSTKSGEITGSGEAGLEISFVPGDRSTTNSASTESREGSTEMGLEISGIDVVTTRAPTTALANATLATEVTSQTASGIGSTTPHTAIDTESNENLTLEEIERIKAAKSTTTTSSGDKSSSSTVSPASSTSVLSTTEDLSRLKSGEQGLELSGSGFNGNSAETTTTPSESSESSTRPTSTTEQSSTLTNEATTSHGENSSETTVEPKSETNATTDSLSTSSSSTPESSNSASTTPSISTTTNENLGMPKSGEQGLELVGGEVGGKSSESTSTPIIDSSTTENPGTPKSGEQGLELVGGEVAGNSSESTTIQSVNASTTEYPGTPKSGEQGLELSGNGFGENSAEQTTPEGKTDETTVATSSETTSVTSTTIESTTEELGLELSGHGMPGKPKSNETGLEITSTDLTTPESTTNETDATDGSSSFGTTVTSGSTTENVSTTEVPVITSSFASTSAETTSTSESTVLSTTEEGITETSEFLSSTPSSTSESTESTSTFSESFAIFETDSTTVSTTTFESTSTEYSTTSTSESTQFTVSKTDTSTLSTSSATSDYSTTDSFVSSTTEASTFETETASSTESSISTQSVSVSETTVTTPSSSTSTEPDTTIESSTPSAETSGESSTTILLTTTVAEPSPSSVSSTLEPLTLSSTTLKTILMQTSVAPSVIIDESGKDESETETELLYSTTLQETLAPLTATLPSSGSRCLSSNECGDDADCERRTGVCQCKPGFRGNPPFTSCEDVDECKEELDDCTASSRCLNYVGGYQCLCAIGYRKTEDKNCVDIDECKENNGTLCDRNAACRNLPGAYLCECNAGFTGDGYTCINIDKRHCTHEEWARSDCGRNHHCLVDGHGVIDCDSCKAGFVKKHGICSDVDECEEHDQACHVDAVCRNTVGGYLCQCQPGYAGDGRQCTDINECANNNVCHPQATCVNTLGSYTCQCPDGWTGDGFTACLNPVDQTCAQRADFCHTRGGNNSACLSVSVANGLKNVCECLPHYRLNAVSGECDDIDECHENRDNCDVATTTCVNTLGSFSCNCASGYEGLNGVCVDIDECQRGSAGCHVNAHCINRIGGVECRCAAGFTGDGTDCIAVDSRQGAASNSCNEDWLHMCRSLNKTCHIDDEEVPQCGSCLFGFQPMDGKCLPINALGNCADPNKNDCDVNAECIDVRPGRHFCSCKIGYIGDGMHCDDVDECSIPRLCDVHATCKNTNGSYECHCKNGFAGNGFKCVLATHSQNCRINPQICHDNAGCQPDGTCKCLRGYEGDGVSICEIASETNKTKYALETTTAARTTYSTESPFLTTTTSSTRCSEHDRTACHVLASCDVDAGECVCRQGFMGDGYITCTRMWEDCTIDETMCHANAMCDRASRQCICNLGHIGDGISCVPDKMDCVVRENLCSDLAQCVARRCVCGPGYTGDGSICMPIEPPAEALGNCSACHLHATCVNSNLCSCNEGCFGNGVMCVPDPQDCVNYPGVCHINGICDTASRRCFCKKGFLGNGFDCSRRISCLSDPTICHAEAKCLSDGRCECNENLLGDGVECHKAITASEIFGTSAPQLVHFECESDCGINADCINGACKCQPGFLANHNLICEDIDECKMNTASCHADATCFNTEGAYECRCKNGFLGNGRECYQPQQNAPSGTDGLKIECRDDGMVVRLTEEVQPFTGRVFVRGQSENPYCTKSFSAATANETIPTFFIPLAHCDMQLEANETLAVTVVVQKHLTFITQKAYAYRLRCTYPAATRTIMTHYQVYDITTVDTIHEQGTAPQCQLRVTNEKNNTVDSAAVGQLLKLTLFIDSNDTFTVVPRNCFAINLETSERYSLTDEAGCAVDEILFPEWTRVRPSMTTATFLTFKWPDSSMIRFECDCAACLDDCPQVNCARRRQIMQRRSKLRFARNHDSTYFDPSELDAELEKELQLVKNMQVLQSPAAYSSIVAVADNVEEFMAQKQLEQWLTNGKHVEEANTLSNVDEKRVCLGTPWVIFSALSILFCLIFLIILIRIYRKRVKSTAIASASELTTDAISDASSAYIKF